MLDHYLSHDSVRKLLAMIVPVWFAPQVGHEEMHRLLAATLADVEQVVRPENLVLVVDGAPHAVEVVQALRQAFARRAGKAFRLVVLPENRGKGAAVLAGLETLPKAPFVALRDADGDHFVDDVPHLVRLAHQMAAECDNEAVLVIGRRTDVHPPLGWLRGEYELLLNEVVLDALRYALAHEGRAPALHYCHPDLPPDFQSGYKVYSAAAARLAAAGLRRAAQEAPQQDMLRWGMELVPLVEVTLAGGTFGEVRRITYHDQPVTAYGKIHRPTVYAHKAAWVLQRCGVAPEAARQMLDNALTRRPMLTDPSGREELLAFRSEVLRFLGIAETPLRWVQFL